MRIIIAVFLFVLAAVCETTGLLLGWKAVKEARPLWFIPLGILVLAIYMFVNTFQTFSFGRSYALYGGVFILTAIVWAMLFDGFRPDRGDVLGATIILIGIAVIWFGIARQTH
ncbi:MAG TPA: YnfA family protein [Ktedonobacteraceae bacterium]|nr:YnfA family protein [Ktedonobacteraceae bacterium]